MIEERLIKNLEIVVNQADSMIIRAELVNKAQYTHGINTTIGNLKYWVRVIKESPPEDYNHWRKAIDIISDYSLKLGGYLYRLKEGI